MRVSQRVGSYVTDTTIHNSKHDVFLSVRGTWGLTDDGEALGAVYGATGHQVSITVVKQSQFLEAGEGDLELRARVVRRDVVGFPR